MRGTLKTAALEHYFPLLAVEHDCILSKNAEVTVAYRVVLPELFTLTGAEYEALHGAWLKALRVLPDYTIVHKQDYFTEEHYRPDLASDESFDGECGDYIFVPDVREKILRGDEEFPALLLRGGEKKPLALEIKNTNAEERELLLCGCIINHYAKEGAAKNG